MRTHIRHAAVALALAAGAGAANAQTVITREITNEPVETIIERGPNGTVITRRPLDTTGARTSVTVPAGSAATETVETVETVRARETIGPATTLRETTGSATTLRGTSDTVAPRRNVVQPARPAVQKQKSVRKTAPSVRAAPPRTVRSTTGSAPVVDAAPAPILTTAQRSTVYRTIVEERAVPRTVITERSLPFPFGPPPVVVDPTLREGTVTERVVTTPPVVVRERLEPAPRVIETVGAAPAPTVTQRVVTTPASVELAVGSRLPTTVPLYALPQNVSLQIPAVRSYRYAVVDDRVFLVDPATGLIVDELEQ